MEDTRIDIKVSPATHAQAKRMASKLGLTMDELIGAALLSWEKTPDEWKQQARAVWDACRGYWKTMNETK